MDIERARQQFSFIIDFLAGNHPCAQMAQRGLDALAIPAAPQEPAGWRDFIVRMSKAEGGMVNGNRLSLMAKELLAAQDAAAGGQWVLITRAGQVKAGMKLRFTIGDDRYNETAALILHPGSADEEIIYNRKQNYYLITSMSIANRGSQKNVEYLDTTQPSKPALQKATSSAGA